eukprot:6108625-Pleurochrysis_carterae.AAC.1
MAIAASPINLGAPLKASCCAALPCPSPQSPAFVCFREWDIWHVSGGGKLRFRTGARIWQTVLAKRLLANSSEHTQRWRDGRAKLRVRTNSSLRGSEQSLTQAKLKSPGRKRRQRNEFAGTVPVYSKTARF